MYMDSGYIIGSADDLEALGRVFEASCGMQKGEFCDRCFRIYKRRMANAMEAMTSVDEYVINLTQDTIVLE